LRAIVIVLASLAGDAVSSARVLVSQRAAQGTALSESDRLAACKGRTLGSFSYLHIPAGTADNLNNQMKDVVQEWVRKRKGTRYPLPFTWTFANSLSSVPESEILIASAKRDRLSKSGVIVEFADYSGRPMAAISESSGSPLVRVMSTLDNLSRATDVTPPLDHVTPSIGQQPFDRSPQRIVTSFETIHPSPGSLFTS
jgi:hypothetical protein